MEENALRLKFRMWNETMKEMTYFENPQITFEAPENKKDWQGRCVLAFYLSNGSAVYFGNYKYIMQCIGICDKNKKPIYEGDIIEFAGYERIMRKAVEWDDKQLCYMVGNMPYELLYNSSYVHRSELLNCEVIGNVFENPELGETP